jgi:hypothetical protein
MAHRLTVKEWDEFSTVGSGYGNGLLYHDKDGVVITNGKILLLLNLEHLPLRFGNCVPVYQAVDGLENWSSRKPNPMGAIGPFAFAPDDKFVEIVPAKSKCGHLVTYESWNMWNMTKKVHYVPMSGLACREEIFGQVNRIYFDAVNKLYHEVKFWADRTQSQLWSGPREINKPIYVTANGGVFHAVIMSVSTYGETETVRAICTATTGLRHD